MNPLSVLNLISSFIFIYLGIYGYTAGKPEPESKLYRLFLLVCVCFSIWGFSFAFLHSATSRDEIEIWYNISSIGWCMFSGFILHAILLMVQKDSVFKKKWLYIAIYAPGIIFTLKEFTGYVYAMDFVKVGYGFSEVPDIGAPWFWIFVIHQTVCEVCGLFLLLFWGRRSTIKREKEQAKIMVITTFLSLVLAFTSDILLPMLDIFIVPALAPVFLLFWGYGIWYSMSRYKFMSLNLAFTADEIASKMKDLFLLVDPDGTIIKINHQVVALLGVDEKDILNKSFFYILKNKETVFKEFHSMRNNYLLSFETDCEFSTIKDETIPIKIHGSIVRDKFGDPIGVVIIAIDLREKIRLQLEIEERVRSEEKYRTLLTSNNVGYYEADLTGSFTFCNDVLELFTGYTRGELIGLNYKTIMTAEIADKVSKTYHRVFLKEISFGSVDHEIIRKDGTPGYFETTISLITDSTGNPMGFRVIGIDVSNRKLFEKALRESEERYRLVMENINDAVFICKLSGHLKYMSPSIIRISGCSGDDMRNTHYLHYIHPDYREQELELYREQVWENIELSEHEYPFVGNDGSAVWVGQTVRMVRNNEGEVEFFGVIRDISERKAAEEARRSLEEAKTRFFSNISHEIRTPLTLMLGPIEAVLQGDYGREVDADFFEILHRNTLRLFKLVNNLLDFSKIEAGRMTMKVLEADIVSFVHAYFSNIKAVGETQNIEMRFNSSADSIMLYFDPEKFDKVLMNLFSNAFKFMKTGDLLTISVSEENDHCRIIVEDTGEGIPEKSVGSIFERFNQASTASAGKHHGTGIGLALVKELVEMHHGSISVESRHMAEFPENHGSLFTITLPKGSNHFENQANIEIGENIGLDDSVRDYRAIEIQEMAGSKSDNGISARCNKKENLSIRDAEKLLLVVDDNADMRNFLKILLQKKYRVIFAENGDEGISRARCHRPDLIVTDVMMPVMNGFEMTSIIKSDNVLKTTPVIMLTADTELVNKVTGLEFGADDYLHKPFNSLELMTRISSLLKNYEYQQIISRRNREIEDELEVARMLQQRLLPESMPEISGYNAHAVYIPMDKVGGDFYNIEQRGDCIDIFIADVSGHGLHSAFLATITKMALAGISTRTSPDEVLYLLNTVILRYTVNSNFVTAFYAMIDSNTRVMRYASAGHNRQFLYREKNGEFMELKTKGTALGWLENSDMKIEEKTVQLDAGDRVIFYTDGITECSNPANELFENDRFQMVIRENARKTAAEFSRELMKELEAFKGGKTFDDDITMVVLDVS
ncbi:MAG: PAS domain S-box protein [bacterium]|nr:PAS domain S-box protein [bacterium]